jgi:hypothetical protein
MGLFSAEAFHALHMIAWQGMVIVAAGLYFVAWALRVRKNADARTVRSVALEIGGALGIFVPLWYVGAWKHGMEAWGTRSSSSAARSRRSSSRRPSIRIGP